MNVSSGAAHDWPEQQVEEALSELERPAMAGIDANALHPTKVRMETLPHRFARMCLSCCVNCGCPELRKAPLG